MLNPRTVIIFVAILVVVGIAAFSSFGSRTVGIIENGTLPPASFPTYTSGLLEVPKGGVVRFYAAGKITLTNYANYCLGVSPKDTFLIENTEDGRLIFITPKSGKTELAIVTSKYKDECGKED